MKAGFSRLAWGICVAVVVGTMALASPARGQFADAQWTSGTAYPSWVDAAPLPELDGVLDGAKWGDLRTVLLDDQVRTDRGAEEQFHHHAQQVVTTTGMSSASTITIGFDPSYARLEIHAITIHRGENRINALDSANVKLIHREDQLDYQIYDGSLEAVALLSDVRVGDLVEWSWTLKGRNPAMGEHYVDWQGLGWGTPVDRIRLRILSSRPLRFEHFNTDLRPQTSSRGGLIDYRWSQDDAPGVDYDEDLPSWWIAQPMVQVTDFSSWGEVATWAADLYDPLVLNREALPAELQGSIAEWSRIPTAAGKIEAALRFVQDDVRYLGIEIGSSGYIPTSPAEVFKRRFGDCKDKSLLLVSILRAMDIEANVALLSTERKQSVRDLLPSPVVFNHAIAVAQVNGADIWMDATRSLQRGGLTARPAPDYRLALVVSRQSTELREIVSEAPSEPQQEISEEFVRQPDGSALLTVTSVTRGDQADASRNSFSGVSRTDTERSYLDFYAGYFSGIEAVDGVVVEDDEAANVFKVTEKYKLPQLWEDGKQEFQGWSIASRLIRPTARARTAPVALEYPLWIRHTIRVKGIGRFTVDSPGTNVETPAVKFRFNAASLDDGVEMDWELRNLMDHVPAEDVASHLEELGKIQDVGWYTLTPAQDGTEFSYLWLLLLPLTGAVGTAVWLGIQGRMERQRGAFRPGESPGTAISGPVDGAVSRFRCSCGGGVITCGSDPTVVRYEDKELLAVETRCMTCGSRQTAYVA